MKLILVRHGETGWNREGRNQGQTQTGLNSEGIRQAHNLGQALRHFPLYALYSSPLPRAVQTAETIGSALSLPIISLPGLMEMDLGMLDGLTNEEMREQFPELLDLWRNDPSSVQMPDGESLQQVLIRARRTVEKIRQESADKNAAAVTHNFVIGVLVLHVLGLPLSNFQSLRIELGSISIIEHHRGRWRLLSLNETLHQRGP